MKNLILDESLKKFKMISQYLKALIRLGEKSMDEWISPKYFGNKFDVHSSTVTEHLQNMSILKYVNYKKYKGVRLTQYGQQQGLLLMRKHRILEHFFVRYLNLTKEEACIEAEKIDLFISESIIDKICAKFSHPKLCPCGYEIFHQ